MKKRTIALVALVFAVVLTGFSVSGTYAKYTSEMKGTDSARVAKWAFNIGGKDATASKTFDFNLFETINDTDNQTAEADVKKGEGEKIIAPGTSGSFTINLENKSEVKAQYKVDYKTTNTSDIPIEFSTNKSDWVEDIADIKVENTDIEMESGRANILVYWRWAYDASTRQGNWSGKNDESDTALGQGGEATVSVEATVTVTQVD